MFPVLNIRRTAGVTTVAALAVLAAATPPLLVPEDAHAAAAVALQLPFECGSTWNGDSRSLPGAHKTYDIDFNSGPTARSDLGRPVLAAAAGKITKAGFQTATGYGNLVHVLHADGTHTAYAHLDRFAPGVRVGAQVKQGQRLGGVGNSSAKYSTTPHLHFEHRRGAQSLPASFGGRRFSYPAQSVTSRNACAKPTTPPARTTPVKPPQHVAADNLDGRLLPDPARRDKVDLYRKGQTVPVVCRIAGRSAYGSTAWALTAHNLYVPGAILRYAGRAGVSTAVPVCRKPVSIKATADLDGRTAKALTASSTKNMYRKGQPVPIVCTALGGPAYNGQSTWARTSNGRWVVRAYLAAPGNGLIPGLPRCDMQPAGNPPVTPKPGTGQVRDGSVWNVSENGIAFIARQEGFGKDGKRYPDQGGWCTVGYGQLLTPKRKCTPADLRAPAITPQTAMSMLRDDLRSRYVPATRRLTAGVPLTQPQFDALTSMVYNLGAEALRTYAGKPTEFITALRSGNHRQIPRLMENFSQESGKYSCGLNKRRIREGIVFSGGSYTAVVNDCRRR